MKRFVLLVGGSGARVAEALLCGACAGVLQADVLDVLLADTDHRGARSAELLRAKYADYDSMQVAVAGQAGASALQPFHTQLNLRTWPAPLPGEADSLSRWTADSEADALLCQALFDEDASALNLREGFHGRREMGEAIFSGLLREAEADPDDPLYAMVDAMCEAAEAGEEVRVVLAGSVCGGTGAAGLPLLARFIGERTRGRARIGAVLLAANGDYEDPAKAKEALTAFSREALCDAVCVLGLPMSSCSAAPADYAHLTDWLALYCMDVLLHRPQWLSGVFTVQAEAGPLSWSVFGKAAERYRLAYGRLIKAAAAWTYVIAPQVEKRLCRPFYLRDNLFGWYAHFFRRAAETREARGEDIDALTRLMSVALVWLGGLFRTLPPELRYADELFPAREEAREHYDALMTLISQLTLLDGDAQKSESYEESFVYRHGTQEEDESTQTLRRIDAVKAEIARRRAEQERLNRRIGGAATMQVLQDALAEAEDACGELEERYAEANRRIDRAESIAAPEDQYRITDARTKLERMTRHREVLEERLAYIRADVERAAVPQERSRKPETTGPAARSAMFSPRLTERLLTDRRLTRKEVEAMWAEIVQPADGLTIRQALRRMRRAPVNQNAPVMSLLHALIMHSMEEV